MKNVVLTGFMGTGKTEVGRELARLLDLKLVDIDTEIEKAERMTINEIFKEFGEPGFREIETEMIKKISEKKNIVISTGGGAVLRDENVIFLKENGIIICLTALPETIFKRLQYNSDRPLLQAENPFQRIRDLLNFRQPFYDKADIMIDTENKTPLQIAEEIIEQIRDMNLKGSIWKR
jgi:shikimate kinase